MSEVENIFLGTDASVRQVAEWLESLLGLEPMPDEPVDKDRIGLRGRASTADGWLGVLVRRNGYAEVDPQPDEVQAFDTYPIEIAIQYGSKDEVVQRDEARIAFEKLVAARPDVPMLLVHDLDLLQAAFLPDAGTHYFPEPPTVDAPDQPRWQPWVRS